MLMYHGLQGFACSLGKLVQEKPLVPWKASPTLDSTSEHGTTEDTCVRKLLENRGSTNTSLVALMID
jgi:hypothetical protein